MHVVGDLPLKDHCIFMCLHVIHCVYIIILSNIYTFMLILYALNVYVYAWHVSCITYFHSYAWHIVN
jgi:hypothetical protein